MPNREHLTRKRQRQAARQERERQLRQQAAARRRRTLAAVTLVVCCAVVVLIVTVGGKPGSSISGASDVATELAGIPQADMTLGTQAAPVTINEYGDLQCTACAAFAAGTLATLINRLVKPGTAKIVFHNWTIIDQTDSVTAAKASYAAGLQGRAWQFIELFYRNQHDERSGYVTNNFLDSVAKAADLDVARFNADRSTPAIAARVREDTRQAVRYGFQGTPSFAVTGARGTVLVQAGAPGDIQAFQSAIAQVR